MVFSRLIALPAFALVFSAVNLAAFSAQAAVDVKQCPKIIEGLYKMNGDDGVRQMKLSTVGKQLTFEVTPDKFIVDGLPHESASAGTYVASCENDNVKISMQGGQLVARYYEYDKLGNYSLTVRHNDEVVNDWEMMSVAAAPSTFHDARQCGEYPGPYYFQDGDSKGDQVAISSSRVDGNMVIRMGNMGRFVFDGKPHAHGDNTYIGRCRESSAEFRVVDKEGTLQLTMKFSRPNSNKTFLFTEFYPERKRSLIKTWVGPKEE